VVAVKHPLSSNAQKHFRKMFVIRNVVQLADLAEIAKYLGLTPTVDPDAIQVRFSGPAYIVVLFDYASLIHISNFHQRS